MSKMGNTTLKKDYISYNPTGYWKDVFCHLNKSDKSAFLLLDKGKLWGFNIVPVLARILGDSESKYWINKRLLYKVKLWEREK
jgi:hypothetical protein